MSKKSKGSLYDEQGNPVWRFQTPFKSVTVTDSNGVRKLVGDPFVLYDPLSDEEHAANISKGLNGELGQLAQGQGNRVGECLHTAEMLDRSVLAVADVNGVIKTSNRRIAVLVAERVEGAVLDPDCDQSILDEVNKKKEFSKMTPGDRAREALANKEKVGATLKPKAPTQ